MDVSVLVCTRNPRVVYLDRVLASLKKQTLPVSRWELVLVDNASDFAVCDLVDLSWHPHGRHVREEIEGLLPARFRAIKESRHDLLVFVDDDNVLAEDYLERALAIRASAPDLGVFGSGHIEAEFEIPPPAAIRPYLSMLAIREVATSRVSVDPSDHTRIPWGAGLCVERSVANRYQVFTERLNISSVLGRQTGRLYQGDDDLFSWIAARNGKQFGVFTELRLKHLIPAIRLTKRYILTLIHDHALSNHIRQFALTGEAPPRFGLWDLLRLLAHGIRRGWFPMSCRMAQMKGAAHASRLVPLLRQPRSPAVSEPLPEAVGKD